MNQRRVTGVLFDLDMTLVETRTDLARSANAVRRTYHLDPLPESTLVTFIGDGARELVRRSMGDAGCGRDDEALARFRTIYAGHCLDTSFVYAGMVDALDALAAVLGLRLGVVSNKPEGFSRQILDGLALARFFTVVIGGDSTRALKPDPEPIREACRRLEISPGDAIMVGDTWRDIRGGAAAGARTIGVTYGLNPRDRLVSEGADAVVDSPAEIVDRIRVWHDAR